METMIDFHESVGVGLTRSVARSMEAFVVQFSEIRMIFEKDTHGNGGVAQLGEHLPCKQGVMGSNPIISTISLKKDYRWKRTGNHQRKRSVAQVVRAHA